MLKQDAAPDVAVTAAPGVAFNYRYAFRLPANRIGAVQERHAAACEALGIARCRITGLVYRLVSDRDVEAQLAFKLEPSLARRFGKMGVAVVAGADGMLVESEITGEDQAPAIEGANRAERDLGGEQAELRRRLAGLPPRAAERAAIAARIEALRDTVRTNVTARDAARNALASTPVVFNYGSGRLVPGFDDRSPIASGLDQAWRNIVTGLGMMILIVGTLLPWAILLAALMVLARVVGARWRRWRDAQDPA